MINFILKSLSDPVILFVVSLQICWLIYSIWCISKVRSEETRTKINYYQFESLPSTFVSIGLLGTCLGIAIGLYNFDVNPDNIKSSVQLLLSGLKSAFFVTILGLMLSIAFKNIINYFLNKYADIQPPESPEQALLVRMNDNLTLLGESITESLSVKFDSFIQDMRSTNERLIYHLNQFSKNLANQNQEALIKALEGVVADLNTGFKDILGSLVKQNFVLLTESVNNLNKWQAEHKQQVVTLTDTFLQVSNNTQTFNHTLGEIVEKNNQIIKQNEKISTIINALNQVIVDDQRYKDTLVQLHASTSTLKTTSETYMQILTEVNSFSKSMENWFKGEGNLTHSILQLQKQLNDLKQVKVNDIPIFEDRLQKTFGTLDTILKAYHEAIPKIIDQKLKGR